MKQDMEKNRAFQEMLAPAKQRLQNRNWEEIARCADVHYNVEKSVFEMKSLNQKIEISYPKYELNHQLEEWYHLILLHYLDRADGTDLSTEYITFGNLKDGLIRGTKFDYTMDKELEKFLKGKTPEQVKEILIKLGGQFLDSRADLTVDLFLFPRYPIRLNIWFEDDEFPISAKMLVNKNADHYLTIEDAVTVGEVILRKLEQYASILPIDPQT